MSLIKYTCLVILYLAETVSLTFTSVLFQLQQTYLHKSHQNKYH